MPLARSRLRARRVEFARAHGSLNLIPLVDILTAIVFFSLLSVVGLRSALASFDLFPPPAAAEATESPTASSLVRSQTVVRVDRDRFVVRDGNTETVIPRPHSRDNAALAALQRALTVRALGARVRPFVTVVPSDDVSYEDVVLVLEQVQQVAPNAVALGTRARVPHN